MQNGEAEKFGCTLGMQLELRFHGLGCSESRKARKNHQTLVSSFFRSWGGCIFGFMITLAAEMEKEAH